MKKCYNKIKIKIKLTKIKIRKNYQTFKKANNKFKLKEKDYIKQFNNIILIII